MNHFVKNIGGLFDPKNHRILRNFSNTLIPRRVDIAEAILIGWEDGPTTTGPCRRHLRSVTSDTADRIRQIPRKILEQGLAVTWPAIQQRIKDPVDVPKFRHVLTERLLFFVSSRVRPEGDHESSVHVTSLR